MALVSSPVPNLLNGVSQQPPQLRLSSQCEAQENAYSSPALGLVKRPPTEFVENLLSTYPDNPPYSFFTERSPGDRSVAIINGRDVKVFDTEGDEKTVNHTILTDVLLARQDSHLLLSRPFQMWNNVGISSLTWAYDIEPSDHTFNIVLERSPSGLFNGDQVTITNRNAAATYVSGTVNLSFPDSQEGHWLRVRSLHVDDSDQHVAVSSAIIHRGTDYTYPEDQRNDLKVLTIGETSFIVNRNQKVEKLPDPWAFNPEDFDTTRAVPVYLRYQPRAFIHEALIYVRGRPQRESSNPENDTELTVYSPNDLGAAFQQVTISPDPSINYVTFAENIADDLKTGFNVPGRFIIKRSGPVVHIRRVESNPNSEFSIEIVNGREEDIIVIQDTIERYSDLPNVAPGGFTVEVTGNPDSVDDNYFVRFVSTGEDEDIGEGYWEETSDPTLVNNIDPATMPHALTREADGSFTYSRPSWGSRIAGDEVTAPDPSFVGDTINNIFSFSNRFGVLSGSRMIMSELGEALNFYPTTAVTLLDTARIDIEIAVQSGGVGQSATNLIHAASHNQHLVLFTNTSQIIVDGGDIFSARTISARLTTEFPAHELAAPTTVGRDLYFSSNLGDNSSIREFFVGPQVGTNNGTDITAHIPRYIPKDIREMYSSPSADFLVAYSDVEPDTFYVYNFIWEGNEKIQSSWSRWTINGASFMDAAVFSDEIFLLVGSEDRGSVDLLRIGLNQPLSGVVEDTPVFLDLLVDEGACTAVAVGFTHSFITPPYTIEEGSSYAIVSRKVDDDDDPTGTIAHTVVAEEGVTYTALTNELLVPGDHWEDPGNPFYFGEVYPMRYEFSQFVLKEPVRDREITVAGDRTVIRTILVDYVGTGEFNLEITPGHTGVTSVHPVGPQVSPEGHPEVLTGNIRRNVLSKPLGTRVVLTSNSHLPCAFLSAWWEAEHQRRS